MKVGIMQPYFLPYIGYFQLINYVDRFVIYDNIEYTKKGWINRNRILVNGKDEYISLPLKSDSDYLDISERKLADSFDSDKNKLLRQIEAAYTKAPQFTNVMPLIFSIFNNENKNLFDFIFHSLKVVCNYLQIKTEILVSSSINIDHHLRSELRVIEICRAIEGNIYVNPIGGVELYSQGNFNARRIELQFIKAKEIQYQQFKNDFIPWLSILDVMMFNSIEEIRAMLNQYNILNN